MRGDKNWTAANEIEHQAWELFSKEFDAWEDTQPADSDVQYMGLLERIDAFFADQDKS